jgi:hypothetical protein
MKSTGAGGLVAGPAGIGVASSAHQFLGAARSFHAGLEYMAKAPDDAAASLSPSCAFVGAQALECVLKSYVSHRGVPDAVLKDKKSYHHDLDNVWREAARLGLGTSEEPPQWCSQLNQVHNAPYLLRYPSYTNGYVLPSRKAVEAELKKLIGMVESAIT